MANTHKSHANAHVIGGRPPLKENDRGAYKTRRLFEVSILESPIEGRDGTQRCAESSGERTLLAMSEAGLNSDLIKL